MPLGLVQSPAGVVMFDTELRIVWVNEAAERLIGGPPVTGWAGRRLGEVLPGIDVGLIERSLRRVLAAREPGVELGGRSGGGDEARGGGVLGCGPVPVARPGPGDRPAGPPVLR